MILHGYWRSGTAYRVRIALALKGLAYDQVTHDLRRGEQRAPDYAALNPQPLVPALNVDGMVLTQSPAILEWLDERHPDPPLLPASADARAIVRAMAAIVACDIHPLNNLRVLDTLRTEFDATPDAIKRWIARWIGDGFTALEVLVQRHGDGFAYGNIPTIADCHLVPQLYAARRFAVDLTPYPALVAADARAADLDAFKSAHPDRQPDADHA
ncbi:maleylacetoacetate isomerase [Sphingomonas prati]|uniref:Maleylpyruvate isomerase n=1 Tax=Sphingomonas prati TaxID=1843237 RepID=A0A7W9BPS2_9SPHN|nr:maleylacetoacetate isomerase [Sphingomonas prati]MBB5727859.1 maleylpyruvate isomerase [Sphingomonas prati]GGE81362.1 maleylacetoacetate isomerase [Sphingomonas prati]